MQIRHTLPAALTLASACLLAGCPNVILTTAPLNTPPGSPGPSASAVASSPDAKASPAQAPTQTPQPAATASTPALPASALPKIEGTPQPYDKAEACDAEADLLPHYFLPTYDGGKPAEAGWRLVATNPAATKQFSWAKLADGATPVTLAVPEGCELKLALVRSGSQTERLFTVAVKGKDTMEDPIKVDFPALPAQEEPTPEPETSAAPTPKPSPTPTPKPTPPQGYKLVLCNVKVYTYAEYEKPKQLHFVLPGQPASAPGWTMASIQWTGTLSDGQPIGNGDVEVPWGQPLDVWQVFEDGKVTKAVSGQEFEQSGALTNKDGLWLYDHPDKK